MINQVKANTFSVLADLTTKPGFYLQATFYGASSIYLNDANTARADAYQLLGGRLGWQWQGPKGRSLKIYVGGDNLLDQTYSLGNDINAAAGRYYNAAPRRNFYTGLSIRPF